MTKYCCSCDFLDVKKEKKGKVSGSKFLCKKKTKEKKKDTYVNPTDVACEKHDKTWNRNVFQNQDIYNKGKHYDDNDTPISSYVIVLVLLIIFGLIFGVFD